MSDLSMAFPIFIFILLVAVLTSFFIITDESELEFADTQKDYETPFTPTYAFDEVADEANEGGSVWDYLWGGLQIVTGVLICAFTGWSGIGLFIGGGLMVSGTLSLTQSLTSQNFVENIPIIGGVFKTMNYVGSGIQSFGNFTRYTIFALPPLVSALITAPIIFFFFVFIIRYIRGQ